MSDFKLKTELTHRFGQTITTSEGEISFDKNGIAEVTEEVYNGADSIHGVERIETPAASKEEGPASDFDFSEKALKTLTMPQLKKIAESALLPAGEWSQLKKDEFVAYILEKVNPNPSTDINTNSAQV